MDSDNFFGFLFLCGITGFSYVMGQKNKERKLLEEMRYSKQEQEILELRRQINQLSLIK